MRNRFTPARPTVPEDSQGRVINEILHEFLDANPFPSLIHRCNDSGGACLDTLQSREYLPEHRLLPE